MKSSNFSACFLFLSLLVTHGFLERSDVFWKSNIWPRLYLFNLRLNIHIYNGNSRGSTNSITATFFLLIVLICIGIVSSEAFSLTEMI